MKAKYTYWLVSYKAFSEKQAQKMAAIIENLSNKMIDAYSISMSIFQCETFIQFAKIRQAINREHQSDSREKKALDLFGDFLQFVEYSNYQFPDLDIQQPEGNDKSTGGDDSGDSDKLLFLGSRIKGLRLDNGMSQEELGSLLGINRAAVNKYEKGSVNIQYLSLVKLCSIFKVSIGYLVGESKDRSFSPYSNLSENQKKSTASTTVPQQEDDIPVKSAELSSLSIADPRKVGQLIREELSHLSDAGCVFSDAEIASFTDVNWTKKHLSVSYPFFKPYDFDIDISIQRVDHLGNGRYWANVFTFGKKAFLVTSEWYKEDKPYFVRWFNQILKDHNL